MLDFEADMLELGCACDKELSCDTPAKTRSKDRQAHYLKPLKDAPPDLELGFLPMLAAAIPMVANLAGSLMSKKSSKGGGPPPEAGKAQDVLDMLTKAVGGDEGKGETSIKDVVKNIVATVPSPVMKQVKDAITQMKNSAKAGDAARDLIVKKVDNRFGPQIHAMLAALKAESLQKQATYEHNKIKARDSFRKEVKGNISSINDKLTRIERRLGLSAVVTGDTRINLLGGRQVLERS